jgi:hypothetical protein
VKSINEPARAYLNLIHLPGIDGYGILILPTTGQTELRRQGARIQ